MRRFGLAIQVGAIVVAVLVGIFIAKLREPPPYRVVRQHYLKIALATAAPVDTLILGDSIGESISWGCGRTFNASIAGAKVSDLAALAPMAVQTLKPKTIIVELGTNHFWIGSDSSFAPTYDALVRSLPARLILVGVPNSQRASQHIKQVAQNVGATYLDPIPANLTVDGVHPTPQGAKNLRDRVSAVC